MPYLFLTTANKSQSFSKPRITAHNRIIADSGCSNHYIRLNGPCTDICPAINSVEVGCPNGATMRSTHTGILPFPGLPYSSRRAHIFKEIEGSLLSLGQLTDHGCTWHSSGSNRLVIQNKKGVTILVAKREASTGLYIIDASQPLGRPIVPPATTGLASGIKATQQAQSAVAKETVGPRIKLLHGSLGFPVTSTWCKAIDEGYYPTVPYLKSKSVCRFLDPSTITAKGHMDQQYANTRSTKPKAKPPPTLINIDEHSEDFFPTDQLEHRTNHIYSACEPITGQVFSDQTGKFTPTSVSGNCYMMVIYVYDCNAILAEAMPNRTKESMVAAYQQIHTKLCSCGFKPQLQRLDNEASQLLKDFLYDNNIDFQLTPAHIH